MFFPPMSLGRVGGRVEFIPSQTSQITGHFNRTLGHAYLSAAYVSALSTLNPPPSTVLDHIREPHNFSALYSSGTWIWTAAGRSASRILLTLLGLLVPRVTMNIYRCFERTLVDDVEHGHCVPPLVVKPSDAQTSNTIESPSDSDEHGNSIIRSSWRRIFRRKAVSDWTPRIFRVVEYCSVSTVTSQPVTHYGLKLQRTASQTLKLPFLDSSAYSGT
ncbi:hypothetical protein CPB85DRAFT_476058 [Mucidula mucida]|nr:hypothetical protein CPB85DRAFT_476058 [Mucidula mucida]